MGNSNESPIQLRFGAFNPTENIRNLNMPPEKSKKKKIAREGKEMPEGEMFINLGYFKAEKDENGKHHNIRMLSKEEIEQTSDMEH